MCVCAACCCCHASDVQVVKPVVSVYPAASRAHLEGRSSLLCLASAMFPPLVQFSWKRRKDSGPLEDVPSAEGEQLQLRESGRTAAILLVHQREDSRYKYRCSVHHEGGAVEAPTEPGTEGSVMCSAGSSFMWRRCSQRERSRGLMFLTHHISLLFCFRGLYSTTITSINISTTSSINISTTSSINISTTSSINISITSSITSSSSRSSPVSAPGEAAVPAVHSADSEESGVLLWTLSADGPQKQGTVHHLITC
ncbi:hypothetical protein VZT92_003511 [Zoarces viviparus]|uniref:Ig-like domain-containing protein n=1 Tax=Zoarces viviparus TaxID=48416 RepID=A0AAW1FUX3_ZOAVI